MSLVINKVTWVHILPILKNLYTMINHNYDYHYVDGIGLKRYKFDYGAIHKMIQIVIWILLSSGSSRASTHHSSQRFP